MPKDKSLFSDPFAMFKPHSTESIGPDGRHTFDLVKGVDTARRLKSGESPEGVDNVVVPDVQSGFSAFDPVNFINPSKESIMAKSKPKSVEDMKSGETVQNEDGTTATLNPAPEREETAQEKKEAAAKAKIAAKAEKAAVAAKLKEEREAAKAARAAAAAELKAAKAATSEARKAELAAMADGRSYTGPMLALTAAAKSGHYIKSATGQLRSVNPLADALDGVTPNGVIQVGMAMLKLESNPYSNLNVGQQSMNLRNKMRGAISKGVFTVADVVAYVTANDLDVSGLLAKEKAEREAKAALAKAEREAKAAAKAAPKVEPEAETTE